MTLDSLDFQQRHLQQVSRSFAFCIEQLQSPLKDWVGISYLLCRVLDTIEDSTFSNDKAQDTLFDQLEERLRGSGRLLSGWEHLFPADVKLVELNLVREADEIFRQIDHLPPSVQRIVQQMALTMSSGMRRFSHLKEQGALRLRNLNEVEEYCYFVAGVVGEALSFLLEQVDNSFVANELVLQHARSFGQFLQKVNILKDREIDEQQGRFLVPDVSRVWASAETDSMASMSFLKSIPPSQVEFRRFCAWSLFLGLETLALIRETKRTKVSREIVAQVLLKTEGDLQEYFGELRARIWSPPQVESSTKVQLALE